MKFGAVPVARGRGRRRGAFDPPGRPGAQEGHGDRQGRDRRARRPPASPRSWWRGSSRATCRRTRPRPRSRRRSRARACASIAPSPAAPICSPRRAGVLVVDKDAIDRLNQVDEVDHVRDAAGLQAGGRGRDDRDREDHSVRGRRAARATPRSRSRARRAPLVRVAPYRIRKVGVVSTVLPGLATKVIDKTLKVTEERLAPAGAGIVAERRVPHEQGALAKALDEVLGDGRRAGHRVRRLGDRRPARRDPGRGRGGRRADRAFRHAGRSRQPAAGRRLRAAGRCSARRAARARPRRTASTGC